MLDGEALDDLAQLTPLEPGGTEGADEVADLAERALEQLHRLTGALRGGRVPRERTLEHLQLGQSGENVLHRPVVHVEHDALQLALTGREHPPRRRPRSSPPPSSAARVPRRPRRASTPGPRSPATTTDLLSRFLKSRSRRPPPRPDSTLVRSSRSSLRLLGCENAVGFHREVLGQPEPVGPRRGLQVPRLDA